MFQALISLLPIYSLVGGPIPRKTAVDGVLVNARRLGPLGNRKCRISDGDESVSNSVVLLFCSGSPFTVLFKVAKGVIGSVKAAIVRGFPHVFNERFKRVPLTTNRYTAPSVFGVVNMFRIFTSLQHAGPYLVCPAPRSTMRSEHGSNNSFVLASAGDCFSRFKVSSPNNLGGSAVANDGPCDISSDVVGPRQNCKKPVFVTGKVFGFVHFRHLEKFTVERVWQAVVKPLFGSYPSHLAYSNRGTA